MHVEHIIPDNNNSLDNLCLACASCNLSKGSATSVIDPDTQKTTALIHVRKFGLNILNGLMMGFVLQV